MQLTCPLHEKDLSTEIFSNSMYCAVQILILYNFVCTVICVHKRIQQLVLCLKASQKDKRPF